MVRFLLILAIPVSVGLAQESGPPSKLPPDVARLKQVYEQEKERALSPLRQRYVAELQHLLDDATRNGKLADAVAIKAEMDATAPTVDAGSAADFERRFTALKWTWNNSWGVTFKTDGTADRGLTWKTVRPDVIEYKYPDGNHGTIVFEHNMSRAAINEVSPSGKKNPMTLYRQKD